MWGTAGYDVWDSKRGMRMMTWRSLFASLAMALVFASLPAFAALGFTDRGGSPEPGTTEVAFVVTETPAIAEESGPLARDLATNDCPYGYEPVVEG
jgi:hypothetical protein